MSSRSLSAVVLAAGEGTRMRSSRPKPLHRLCGRALVLHVIDALAELPVERVVVVVGHGAERVAKTLQEQAPADPPIEFVEQPVARGSADAASMGLTGFPDDDLDDGDVLVIPGDAPLLRAPTLAALVRHHRAAEAAATLLTVRLGAPGTYARVLRGKDDRVHRVAGAGEASPEERDVEECNTSVYCFRRSVLAPALRRVSPDNPAGEHRLSDVIGVLSEAGYSVVALEADDPMEAARVNDRAQLAVAEAELRDRTNERWMRRGVTMLDPERTYVDASVQLAPDVTLFPGTLLQGSTIVAAGARIGPDTRLVDCVVGESAVVEQTAGEQAEVGAEARVGPFAVLPPGSRVLSGAVTGPFYVASEEQD